MTINLNPPRGTRDFYPENLRKRDWLFAKWRHASKSASFDEYDAPIMEHADLWNQKSGSDITKEMFCFEKEQTQYCLRPEMTPSLTRMMMSVYKSIQMPARWFSIPQCWRYETTARGRKREFYQWNMDVFGATPVKSEVEILGIICQFLESVNLTPEDVVIKISDRRLITDILKSFGIPDDKLISSYNIIDKIPKLTQLEIIDMFKEIDISEDVVQKIFKIINTRDLSEISEYKDTLAYRELNKIIEICENIGIWKWCQIDFLVIRGLDYYTGIVFEGFFKNSELKRAILGGGRYDNLMATYGADPIPALGFGMGDVVIMDVLEELKLLPETPKHIDYLMISFNENLMIPTYQMTNQLRKINNLKVELYIGKLKLKSALDYANRIKVKYVIIIAPGEWEKKQIIIRNMTSSQQNVIEYDIFYNSLLSGQKYPYLVESVQGYSDSDN